MADAVRDGRTLLLVPKVIDECYMVFSTEKPDTTSVESIFVGDESGAVCEHIIGPVTHEDLYVEPESRDEFECLLAESLRMWGIDFVAVLPRSGIASIAKEMHAKGQYKNDKGVPLSLTDCHLLSLAIENHNVDILTDDKTLTKATVAECSRVRVSEVLNDYFGRLNMTARFLSRMLNTGFVDCRPIRDRIEYHATNTRSDQTNTLQSQEPRTSDSSDQDPSLIVAIQCSPDGMSTESCVVFRNLDRGAAYDAMCALLDFVSLVVLDWYCACEDPNWYRFDRKWTESEWDFDTMKIKSKTRKPYYELAKDILERNRERYCACTRPDKRLLHEAFRTIASTSDQELNDRLQLVTHCNH